MAETTLSTPIKPGAYPHAVKFYEDSASLSRTVAAFLAPGLRERLPAIVIATPAHRQMIARELEQRGIDVGGPEGSGDLLMVDADDLLARVMEGSRPAATRFHAEIQDLIERACRGRLPCPLRAYGEMVDVLWRRANPDGALQLEMLWNSVTTRADFSLLCGYAVGNFYKEIAKGATMRSVCDHHTHVMAADETA